MHRARASAWCCTPATTARRSRSRRFSSRACRLPASSDATTAIARDSRRTRATGVGIELFESPHSFEVGGQRILLVHDIGDVRRAVDRGARDRRARLHAHAGDGERGETLDRESRRGVRLAVRHAVGRDPRSRHEAGRVHLSDGARVDGVTGSSRILIIDYGSQFTQLIARRVREARVYSEIHPPTRTVEWIREWKPTGIILSGGPNSVYGDDVPTRRSRAARRRARARHLLRDAAHRASAGRRGHRRRQARVRPRRARRRRAGGLFDGFDAGEKTPVWMSHGDHVDVPPPGFRVTARAAAASRSPRCGTSRSPIHGVQFHPEVAHTPRGARHHLELPVRRLRRAADLDARRVHRGGDRRASASWSATRA